MSSQHDEAPARPDESGPPALPAHSTGIPAGHGPATSPGTTAARSLPWKMSADGRAVFRRGSPFVIWWLWVAFAIYNAAEIAIPDHDYFSLELAAGLLAVTAVMYACTVRPRVLADDDGVVVRNPFRDHRIRWGALTGVYLGDSVEFGCARPAPQKEKTIYSWALFSGRRGRMRAQMRAERDRARTYGVGTFRRAQADAQELGRQDVVPLMAAEIGRRLTAAKQGGVPDAVLQSTWAWWPLVYLVVPAALLLGLLLGR